MTNHLVSAQRPFGLLRAWTGLDFDLPTLAQWEYACRAGTTGGYYDENPGTGAEFALGRCKENGGWKSGYSGDPKDKDDIRNWRADEGGTAIVGRYRPNPWGIYDMLGNIWEWTLGWPPDTENYLQSPCIDPHGGSKNSGYTYVVGSNWYRTAADSSIGGGSDSGLDRGNSRKGGFRLCVPVSGRW